MTRMEWLVIVTVASKENTCVVNLAYFLDYWFKRMLLKKKKKKMQIGLLCGQRSIRNKPNN